MSDDMFEDDEDVGGGSDEGSQGGKKIGFLPSVVIQILKFAAMGLGGIIFIVTVVIITMRIMNSGSQPQSYATISSEYQAKPPILGWYELEEIRGRTADDVNNTYIIVPNLGYDLEDKALQTELNERKPRILDLTRTYFSSKTAVELKPANEYVLKEELKNKINDIMKSGKIKEVIFVDFNVVEF